MLALVVSIEVPPASRDRFLEANADEAALDAHGGTEHFARWRAAAAECGLALERTAVSVLA